MNTLQLVFAGFVVVVSGGVIAVLRQQRVLRSRRELGRAIILIASWMMITGGIARAGVLFDFERRPPPFMVLMGVTLALCSLVAFSRFGTHLAHALPLAWLIGLQGFRLPLEVIMHWAGKEGVMPVQMSYAGSNFDIVSGASAIVVAMLIAKGRAGVRVAWLWNLVGTALLINILQIAIRSTPLFAHWGPQPERLNTWVCGAPYVWLPTVLVSLAVIGHLLLYRRLFVAFLSVTRK